MSGAMDSLTVKITKAAQNVKRFLCDYDASSLRTAHPPAKMPQRRRTRDQSAAFIETGMNGDSIKT